MKFRTRPHQLLLVALVATLFSFAVARPAQQPAAPAPAWDRSEILVNPRLRNRLGPAHIRVEDATPATPGAQHTERVIFPSGAVVSRNKWGSGPLVDGLAVAINGAIEGDVISVRGRVNGVSIGGPANQAGKTGCASWSGNRPVDVAIVGEDASAAVLGVSLWDGLGGIDRLTLCGLTILGPPGSSTAIIAGQGSDLGRLRIWACVIEPADRGAWHGFGYKWAIRCQGHLNGEDGPESAWTNYTGQLVEHHGDGEGGGFELLACAIWPGEEHAYWYLDNVGPTKIGDVIRHPEAPHTLVSQRCIGQITNRANPAGVTAGGPSGYGLIEIYNVESTPSGSEDSIAGQGYAYTIAGQLGGVWLHDLKIRDYNGGAVTIWTDGAQIKGVWTFADGFSTGRVRLERIDAASAINDNPSIMLGGCRSVELGPFSIKARNNSVDLDAPNPAGGYYSGPILTGPLTLTDLNVSLDQGGDWVAGPDVTASSYTGWAAGGRVRRKGKALTPTELDALQVAEASTK